MRDVTIRLTAKVLWLLCRSCVRRGSRSTGQLRNPSLRCGHNSPEDYHDRTPLQLHHPRSKYYIDGVIPTNHEEHETLELTEGLTSGLKSASTSSRVSKTATVCSWSEITYARASAHQVAGICPWAEPLDESWLPAGCVFAGYMDLGDTADHRQDRRTLVLRIQPCA
jgi:hypothetical protein